MAEPIIIGAISGLVALMTAYMNHRHEMEKLEQEGQSAPPNAKTGEVDNGERVMQVVEKGIAEQGSDRERTALQGFQQDPQMFANVLEQAMKNLTERNPTFAQQLQRVAEQTNVAQTGNIHYGDNVSGDQYKSQSGDAFKGSKKIVHRPSDEQNQ